MVKFSDECSQIWTPMFDNAKNLSDDSGADWLALVQNGQSLDVFGSGTGGRGALQALFEANPDKVLYCVFRVVAVDEKNGLESKRVKFMFVKYIGESAGVLAKGRASGIAPEVKSFLGDSVQYTVDVSGNTLADDLSTFSLGRKLIAAGGAHKPVRYDFGGAESIAVDALDTQGVN